MPSSTSLVEAEEGESEVPPPLVHAFAGMGLEEHHGSQSQTPEQTDESLPHHHYHFSSVSHFNFLGTVLDLKPLHRPSSADEGAITAPEDEEQEVVADSSSSGSSLLAQAHLNRHLQPGPGCSMVPSGLETPQVETVLLYNGDDRDDGVLGGSNLPPTGSMVLVPSSAYGEFGFEAEPSLLNRRKSVNTTECVAVPSSEHVAEIVGRQGEWLEFNCIITQNEVPLSLWELVQCARIASKLLNELEDYMYIETYRGKTGCLEGAAKKNLIFWVDLLTT